MNDAQILEAARAWLADDPDPDTRAATEALIAKGDPDALRACFGDRLEFGTAGLRGALGPGPNRMNRALVRKVTAGLADHVLAVVPDAVERGVVIGFDGRVGSRVFAEDAARVLAGRGLPVLLHAEVCPTPQLSHAVTWLGTAAGIMVTASHNPPQDNGYKVYWGNGAQIIPPHDGAISAAIDRVGSIADLAVPPLDALRAAGVVQEVPAEAERAYIDEVLALRVHAGGDVRVVYTALHGVGARVLRRVFGEAGHADLHVVPEQEQPVGAFPTVKFPNPEEPGALDLAKALAKKVGADVVIANDPDADRLAVAIPEKDDTWRTLNGNQIGVLLAADLLEHGPGEEAGRRLVATSIVSSRMLETIAADHDVAYVDTLTGFKWIANAAIDHEARGGRFVMGYEEALGYSVGLVARDKDGISAALVLVDLVAWGKARGETLLDRLEALYRRYGYFASQQRSLVMPGEAGARRIAAIMDALRAGPPGKLGGRELTRVRDLLTGRDRDLQAGTERATTLPESNVLHFQYGPDLRVLARPSGTEPKLKLYFEVRDALGEGERLADVASRSGARVSQVADELLERVTAV